MSPTSTSIAKFRVVTLTGRSVSIVGLLTGYVLGFSNMIWMVILSGLLLSSYSLSLESLVRLGRHFSKSSTVIYGGMVVQAVSFSTALDSFLFPRIFSRFFLDSLAVFFVCALLLYLVWVQVGRMNKQEAALVNLVPDKEKTNFQVMTSSGVTFDLHSVG